LGAEGANAADDQPAVAEDGLGDLRDARGRIVLKRLPGVLGDLLDDRADTGVQAHPDRVLPAGALELGEGGV
jgi:hypothetical protein